MADLSVPVFANRLLSALSDEDRQAIALLMTPVSLEVRQRIEEPGWPIEQIYFVETGMISVVSTGGGKKSVEVGMIGFEGLTGSAVALGDHIPSFQTFVQIPGRANRMPIHKFEAALLQHPNFASLVLRYARVLWIQSMATALANVHLGLASRLARWLLMMDDRVEGNRINITHEFLALMLHARRPGVTVALHILEGHHLIVSRRGALEITNRAGLIEFSAGSYGMPEADYSRLIG